jgi:glycosyltransferase involved in cell wall biosynthesis
MHGESSALTYARALARWSLGVGQGYPKGWFVRPRRHLGRRRDERSTKLLSFADPVVRVGRRRLRVALVSQQYPPDACGGVGVYTERLARGLVEAGHAVTVIAHGTRDAVVWRDGVKVHRVRNAAVPAGIPRSYGVTRKNVGRSLAVHRLVHELDRQDRIDIVESPLWDAEPFALCLERSVPLVIRVETPMAMAIQTQGWRWTPDLEVCCAMEWACLRGPDGIVDPSGTVLDMIRETYGVAPGDAPVREIPFGTVIPETTNGAVDAAAGTPSTRVLFVGRLEARKGIDVLGRAIPRVVERCPGVEFLLVGEQPAGFDLDDILGSAGAAVRKHVRCLGRVDDGARAELYRTCDLFVAPSRYESFGIVYIEAFSYGKPVIACDAGGARRIVDHGRTGLLVPPGDAEALAEALVTLVHDRPARERMGRAARKKAEAEYGVDTMVRRTVEFYESLLDGVAGEPT